MKLQATYPTLEHEAAAKSIVHFFSARPEADSVLLVNSCARGKASRDSCLDIIVLARPDALEAKREEVEGAWERYYEEGAPFKALLSAGKYSEVHLDVIDGQYAPGERNWTGGPDSFELEVGNHLAYSVPLWERGSYYRELKEKWLPFYSEELRAERLQLVSRYFFNNLGHIPLYVERELYFQSFDRFYNAFREFLQALFISRRIYPIAYDKWIREQIEEILGLPELYRKLPQLFEISNFESREIADKAEQLRQLYDEYVGAGT